MEVDFYNPTHSRGWKYNVGLDEAFNEILRHNPPPGNTNEFIAGLDSAIQSLNAQAGLGGLPEPYKGMADRALDRLRDRNDGSPKLCAWVLSSNISLVLSIIESFGDTRSAAVQNASPHGGRTQYLPLHEGITLKKEDHTSLTGRSRERGDLWGHMYGVIQDIPTVTVQDIDAYNIPGHGIVEAQFCELIHKMSLNVVDYSVINSGYTEATMGQDATLSRDAWRSFCTIMGANDQMTAFLETLWPGSPTEATVSVDSLAALWKELLENEENYRHLRYLFGRKFERVYQELVIENVRDE